MISTYIFCGFCAITVLAIFGRIANNYYRYDKKKNAAIASVLIGVILALSIFIIGHWWLNSTASGQRAVKDTQSNLTNGINRIVTVYDISGEVIKTYRGKIDIELHETYVVFDEGETGLRHIVYFTTGTVIIDEE